MPALLLMALLLRWISHLASCLLSLLSTPRLLRRRLRFCHFLIGLAFDTSWPGLTGMLFWIVRKSAPNSSTIAPSADNGAWIPRTLSATWTLQHPVWVQKFSRVVQLLTAFRRTMVFPCRYCSQTQVNKHTQWRTCIVLQVSCFLHLHLQYDGVHGGSGDVCSGASLLRRGVSIPAADGAQEGARKRAFRI